MPTNLYGPGDNYRRRKPCRRWSAASRCKTNFRIGLLGGLQGISAADDLGEACMLWSRSVLCEDAPG